mmetsp:Transcript_8334/g.31156  ORF Transcript_8334/g.31156 Transcript_8334/m.31156 type:complete len:200 (-) Transcript_8334:1348-1947(-)
MSSPSNWATRETSSTRKRLSSVSANKTCFRNPGSVRNNCAPSATVSVKSRPPPFPCPPFGSEVRAKVTRFSKRAHWKVPSLLKSTWVSRVLKLASRSVNNRFATYGYATSRNRKSGLKVMQMPSCVSKDRMTRLNRSGIRMGYWYTSWLNAPVTVRKLKFARLAVRASCQMDSSAGTIGRTSVPFARKPRFTKSYAIAS